MPQASVYYYHCSMRPLEKDPDSLILCQEGLSLLLGTPLGAMPILDCARVRLALGRGCLSLSGGSIVATRR
jgi:hypothetical protein